MARIREECASAVTDLTALDALKGRRILITGGTGFMGTWLAETVTWLNDEHAFGIELSLLSRSASGLATRLPHLGGRPDVTLIDQDVRDVTMLPAGTDLVIHAAGSPDNRAHATDPLRTMSTIATGTSALLRAASRSERTVRVLNVSSGLVYGPQPLDLERLPESYVGGPEPDSISSIYAEAKRFAEAEAAAWRSQEKLAVVTARPFAFIGPHQGLDKPWAINNFLRDALMGAPIRILGDADTVRSYLYPSDMAYWLLVMLATGTAGSAYNVGSPNGITLGELAGRIAEAVSDPSEAVCRPLGQPRVTRFVPDVTRALSELGLSQTVDLDEAILRTLSWHRATGAAPAGRA